MKSVYEQALEYAKNNSRHIDPTEQITKAFEDGYYKGQNDLFEQSKRITETPRIPNPNGTEVESNPSIKKERLFP